MSSTTQDTSPVHGENVGNGNVQLSAQPVRELCKSGWLKKMVAIERRRGQFSKNQKIEKFWIVFCIHDNKNAMLEFYNSVHHAFTHQPLESYSLNNCLHVSPCIQAIADDYEFAVTLDSQVIRLGASSREEVWEWIDMMKNKLRELKILEPKDNLYSREPVLTRPPTNSESPSFDPLSSTPNSHQLPAANVISQIRASRDRLVGRNPMSPLPPVPPEDLLTNNLSADAPESNANLPRRNPINSVSNSTDTGSPTWSESSVGLSADHHYHSSPSVFDFDLSAISLRENSGPPPVRRRPCVSEGGSGLPSPFIPGAGSYHTVSNSLYEPLCASSSSSLHGSRQSLNSPSRIQNSSINSFGDSRAMQNNEGSLEANRPNFTAVHIPENIQEGVSQASFVDHGRADAVVPLNPRVNGSGSFEPLPLEEGPPAYSEVAASNPNIPQLQGSQGGEEPVEEAAKQLSLKEAQVARLQKEISHSGGVRLMLRKTDCAHAIALVECFGSVWIAGWKQKDHPYLYNTLHVGDCVLSIAGRQVHTVQEATKAIKHHPISMQVEFIIRRVPHGRVFALKRDFEGQDLGLVREGNSAEIKEVIPDGLAARHGLPLKAPTVDGTNLCHWVLTEINNRPLNLFFKDNEVRDRLNAVGKDISILVQPADLVKTLKKQLKALSSYKKYIVQ